MLNGQLLLLVLSAEHLLPVSLDSWAIPSALDWGGAADGALVFGKTTGWCLQLGWARGCVLKLPQAWWNTECVLCDLSLLVEQVSSKSFSGKELRMGPNMSAALSTHCPACLHQTHQKGLAWSSPFPPLAPMATRIFCPSMELYGYKHSKVKTTDLEISCR